MHKFMPVRIRNRQVVDCFDTASLAELFDGAHEAFSTWEEGVVQHWLVVSLTPLLSHPLFLCCEACALRVAD